MSAATDTVVACLTPAGAGAIATLAVHGPEAWRVCRVLFTPVSGELPDDPSTIAPGRFFLGQLGQELRDEVILAVRRTTPVPWVELHCHGGREVIATLLVDFERQGLRVLSWREWLHRTEVSPFRAEAAIQLAHAPTPRTAAILLDQYHGAFEQALAAIDKSDPHGAQLIVEGLLRYANLGTHLVKPWRVAVAGPPNVGKSSLVNALAGFQRCVVSEIPGTTRDVVTTTIAVEGWPVELADTAGLRESGEAVEEAGVRLAREASAAADLTLWVLDASMPPVFPESIAGPLLHVVNKIDLPAAWEPGPEAVRVSARTGQGLEELCAALARKLVPEVPPEGAAVPISEEWCALVASGGREPPESSNSGG